MRRRRSLRQLGPVFRRDVGYPQRALQQLLRQRIGNGLLQRVALRFQNLPVLLPQRGDKFMDQSGFSDAGRANERNDLPGRSDLPCRPIEQGNLFSASDE